MSTIKNWAEADRPREKMLQKGVAALTDAELLAILIGSGTVGQNALALAQDILVSATQDLNELGRYSIKQLQKFKGIGEAKAITIAAALELGRRRKADTRIRTKLTSSKDAFEAIAPLIEDHHHEEFWILLVNRANEIIRRERISSGGSSSTIVDIKMVFRIAIDHRAEAIIAVHNHPSGQLTPSQSDRELTKRIAEAGKIMDIALLDHLIVSQRGYYSFADEGLI
jgi:DNA repair protein RadC